MPGDTSQLANTRQRLIVLSEQFEALAVEEPLAPPQRSDVWEEVVLDSTLLLRVSRRRSYERAVEECGRMLVLIAHEALISDERLQVIVAAHDSHAWGDLAHKVENVFAMFVGGDRLELVDAGGRWAEYEAHGATLPPSLRSLSDKPTLCEIAAATLPVRPARCRAYAGACRRLAHTLPQLQEAQQSQDEREESLSPSRRAAWHAYQRAISQNPDLKTQDEVYDWLKEHDSDCDLPGRESFKTYIREAARHLGAKKNTPVGGRIGRSVRKSNEL